MSKLILLILGALWLAVLLPPILRSKIHNSPAAGVSQFRRQANSLQRFASTPQAHMRGMSRDLAPNQQNQRRSGYPQNRPNQQFQRNPRQAQNMGGSRNRQQGYGRSGVQNQDPYILEFKRQRNQKTVVSLTAATGISLFLALSSGAMFFLWTFTLSFIALVTFCWFLVQQRVKRDLTRNAQRFSHRTF